MARLNPGDGEAATVCLGEWYGNLYARWFPVLAVMVLLLHVVYISSAYAASRHSVSVQLMLFAVVVPFF